MNLPNKHKVCFPEDLPKHVPPKRDVEHMIKTGPSHSPPSQPELDKLKKQHEELHSFIVRSSSPLISAPIFFVRKGDGFLRLVRDWIPLNNMTDSAGLSAEHKRSVQHHARTEVVLQTVLSIRLSSRTHH